MRKVYDKSYDPLFGRMAIAFAPFGMILFFPVLFVLEMLGQFTNKK